VVYFPYAVLYFLKSVVWKKFYLMFTHTNALTITYSTCVYLFCSLFYCRLNLELRNNTRETILWLALLQINQDYLSAGDEDLQNYESSFAARLIKRGSSVDATDPMDGNCLLHKAAAMSREEVGVFLVRHEASPNLTNVDGEAPLHLTSLNDLPQFAEELLLHGADPNCQTNLKVRPRSASVASEPVNTPETSVEMHSSNQESTSETGYSSLPRPLALPPGFENVSSTLSALTGMGMTSTELATVRPYTISKPQSTNPFGSEEDLEAKTPSLHGLHGSLEGLQGTPIVLPRRVAELQQEDAVRKSSRTSSMSEWSDTYGSEEFIEPSQSFDIESDSGQRSPLHVAISCQHVRVVDVLLKHRG